MTTTSIPNWEVTELQQLGLSGALSGVAPVDLEAIDQAESSGEGGYTNSSGYGGWFGLKDGGTYPAGTVSDALIHGTDPTSFADQAEIAASAFSSYLAETGGDPLKAEEIFQTGSDTNGPTQGSTILSGLLGGDTPQTPGTPATSTSSPTATDTSFNVNPFDLFGIPQTVAGSAAAAVWSEVGPFIVKAVLVVAGLGIVGLGLYKAASPDKSLTQRIGSAATDAAKVAPEVAAA